jgi:hypothetical protein
MRKKNPGLGQAGIFFGPEKVRLNFGDRDGPGRAHFDAALTAQALVLSHHTGFVILHLKDTHRTNVNAFLVAGALVFVHFNAPRHRFSSFRNWLSS